MKSNGNIMNDLKISSDTNTTDEDSKSSTMSNNEYKQKKLEAAVEEVATSMLVNTSCLAIANVFIRKYKFLKIIWCLAAIFCTAATIIHLYWLTANYLSYHVSTITELRYKPVQFPSVTICNLNPIRMSAVKQYGNPALQQFIADINNKYNGTIFIDDKQSEIETNAEDLNNLTLFISQHDSQSRFLMGHQLRDVVVQCNYNGLDCDYDKLFRTVWSMKYGNCFIFTAQSNYTLPRKGLSNGLTMTLMIDQPEYLPNLISSGGIRVHLHEPYSVETPQSSGYSIPTGFEVSLGLLSETITRLPLPYNDCVDGLYWLNTYHIKYTIEGCYQACTFNLTQSICGCYNDVYLNLYQSSVHITHPCASNEEIVCMIQIANNNSYNTCDCKLPCHEYNYLYRQSYTIWPLPSYEKRIYGDLVDVSNIIGNMTDKSSVNMRKNLVNLVIYDQDDHHIEIKQKPTFEWVSYLSEVGGSLNLFLGFSLLTGFEFLEGLGLLLTYLYSQCLCRSRKCASPVNERSKLVQ